MITALLLTLALQAEHPVLDAAGITVNEADRRRRYCRYDAVVRVVEIGPDDRDAVCLAVPSNGSQVRVGDYTAQIRAAGWQRQSVANSRFIRPDQPEGCRDVLTFDVVDGGFSGGGEAEDLFIFQIEPASCE